MFIATEGCIIAIINYNGRKSNKGSKQMSRCRASEDELNFDHANINDPIKSLFLDDDYKYEDLLSQNQIVVEDEDVIDMNKVWGDR